MVKRKKEPDLIPQVLPTVTLKKIPKIVTLLIKVNDPGVIETVCLNDLKIPESELDAAMSAARGELVKAANFHVMEEFGRAILTLRELFTSNIKIKDYKTALATLKEICRLQRLYNEEQKQRGALESPDSVELNYIRQLLLTMVIPYGITKREDVPVAEMIRLLLLDYMRLRNEADAARPTPGTNGGKELSGVARPPRNLPAPARSRPCKKK